MERQEALDQIYDLKNRIGDLFGGDNKQHLFEELFDRIGVEEKEFRIQGEFDQVMNTMFGASSSLGQSDLGYIMENIADIIEKEGRIPTDDELSTIYGHDEYDWAYFGHSYAGQDSLSITYATASGTNVVSMLLSLENGKIMAEASHRQEWSSQSLSSQARAYAEYGIKQEAVTPHKELAERLDGIETLLALAEYVASDISIREGVDVPSCDVSFGDTTVPLSDGSRVPSVHGYYINRDNSEAMKILKYHPELAEDLKAAAEKEVEKLKGITYPEVYQRRSISLKYGYF